VARWPARLHVRSERREELAAERLSDLVARAPEPVRVVVIDCSMVPTIDLNAAGSLRALARTLGARGIALHLAELRDDVAESLRASGAGADLGSIVSHQTIEDGLARVVRPPD